MKKEDAHPWDPLICGRLEQAITGLKRRFKQPISLGEANKIKQRINTLKWRWIVKKKGWEKHLPTPVKSDLARLKPKSSVLTKGASNELKFLG